MLSFFSFFCYSESIISYILSSKIFWFLFLTLIHWKVKYTKVIYTFSIELCYNFIFSLISLFLWIELYHVFPNAFKIQIELHFQKSISEGYFFMCSSTFRGIFLMFKFLYSFPTHPDRKPFFFSSWFILCFFLHNKETI